MDKDQNSIELLKIAIERLRFQDEYLFKFSALFLTINSGLGYVLKESMLSSARNTTLEFLLALLGVSLSSKWLIWVRHNDTWHYFWTQNIRYQERKLDIEMFSMSKDKLASEFGNDNGFQKNRLLSTNIAGHKVAETIPILFIVFWGVLFFYLLLKCAQ